MTGMASHTGSLESAGLPPITSPAIGTRKNMCIGLLKILKFRK